MSERPDIDPVQDPVRARWHSAWTAVQRAIDVAQSNGMLHAVECGELRARLTAERELLERLLA